MRLSPIYMDEKVHELVDIYINDIQNNDFVLFFTELRNEIGLVVEEHIRRTYELYNKSCSTQEIKQAFCNVETGYKAIMRQYVNDNNIDLVERKICLDDIDVDISIPKSSLYTITGGTIIAVALGFAVDIWLSVVVELVTIGLAYKFYSDTCNRAKAIKLKQTMEDKKEEFAQKLISDINNWLNMFAAESDKTVEKLLKNR